MKQIKGIVTRISGDKCIILTPEGEFRRLPLPSGPIRVGQEISCFRGFSTLFSGWSRYATLAACLLLVLVGLLSLQQPASADAAAYISLDINPSLELAVNTDYKVIGVRTLNQDAKRLLNGIEYQNQDVYQVLSAVLEKAIELQYVSREKSNLVVSSVVELNPKVQLDAGRLQKAVAQPLKAQNLKVSVVFLKANKAEREQANSLELSTGKYILFKEDKTNDSQETLDYYRSNSLSKLANENKLKMPVERMKMLISDTTDWEDETTLPPSSNAVSQHYKWANETSDKRVYKQNIKQVEKTKIEAGSEKENSARIHSPATGNSKKSSVKTNLKEKEKEPSKILNEKENSTNLKEKEKSKSLEQDNVKAKENDEQEVKGNTKEKEQVNGRSQDKSDEKETKNKANNDSKGSSKDD